MSAAFISNPSFTNGTFYFSRNHLLRHDDVYSTVMTVNGHMLLTSPVAKGNHKIEVPKDVRNSKGPKT